MLNDMHYDGFFLKGQILGANMDISRRSLYYGATLSFTLLESNGKKRAMQSKYAFYLNHFYLNFE